LIPCQFCLVCKNANSYDATICSQCGKPLDLETAIIEEEKEKSENKIQKMELEKIKKELANMDEKWVNKFEQIARDIISKGEKGELDFQKQSD